MASPLPPPRAGKRKGFMELLLAKFFGILLGSAFTAWLLGLSPRTKPPRKVEPDAGGEGDYIFRVTRDEVMRGAWPAQQKRGEQ